jgi:hypothetical protein
MTAAAQRDMPAYASLAAFLAHYRALSNASRRWPEDDRVLAALARELEVLSAQERAALDSASDTPAARRHRERAEFHLRRELLARGAIAG